MCILFILAHYHPYAENCGKVHLYEIPHRMSCQFIVLKYIESLLFLVPTPSLPFCSHPTSAYFRAFWTLSDIVYDS